MRMPSVETEEIEERIQHPLRPRPSADDLDFWDFLIVVAKRRRPIALITLGVAVLASVTAYLLTTEYSAAALVLPPGQNSASSAILGQLAGSGALASAAGASLGLKSPGDLYVSLFLSRTIQDNLIQRFGLQARYKAQKLTDARTAFLAHSSVLLGSKDGLITVVVTDRDPKMAADIANAYVDEFRKLCATLAVTEASQRRAFFQQQLLEVNQNLAVAEDSLKRTEQTTGVLQVDSQTRSVIESVASLRAQIAAKEVQIQSIRSYAADDNPDLYLARQQLAALQAQLAKLAGADDNSDMSIRKGSLTEAGMEYLRKVRDMRYYESMEDLISKQFEMAKLDEAHEGAIVQVVDGALPPDKKSGPHRSIIVALATLVAFASSLLWALADDKLSRIQQDPEKSDKLLTLRRYIFRPKNP